MLDATQPNTTTVEKETTMPSRVTRKEAADNPYGTDDDDDDNSDDDNDNESPVSGMAVGKKCAPTSVDVQKPIEVAANVTKKMKKSPPSTKPTKRNWKRKTCGSEPFIRPVPSHLLLSPVSSSTRTTKSESKNNGDKNGKLSSSSTVRTSKGPGEQQQKPATKTPILSPATVDPRIQRDFIAIRNRAFDEARDGTLRTLDKAPSSVWEGVSSIEKEMILCCETTPLVTSIDQNNDLYSSSSVGNGSNKNANSVFPSLVVGGSLHYPIGGVLSVDKEVRFATILASRRHTMDTKSLAVAILERTIEQLLWEQRERELKDAKHLDAEGKQTNGGDVKTVHHEKKDEEKKEVLGDQVMTTRSSRFTRVQQNSERQDKNNRTVNGRSQATSTPTARDDFPEGTANSTQSSGRLERFFAAGGLNVLSQWLADAASYESHSFTLPTIPQTKNNTGSKSKGTTKRNAAMAAQKKQEDTTIHRASSTRPIVISILRFLEHIPFDKKCVTDSKINKQIQKLGKKIGSILEAEEVGEAPDEDLKNWTADPSVSSTDALNQVGEAVAAVKKSWKEKAKNDTDMFPDPFLTLRETMKSRVQEYKEFQAGNIDKPDWYNPRIGKTAETAGAAAAAAAAAPGRKRENSTSTPGNADSAAQQKKRKTLEMAAKERMAEREKFQKQLAELRKKREEQLHQLHAKLKKRMDMDPTKSTRSPSINNNNNNSSAHAGSNFTPGRVSWKDGEKGGIKRNRRFLEEVFIFDKESPSAVGTLKEG
jgi:hypothetical protein